MGAKLGDLVVSLEANMAKFQSDMNKSAQVTEQSMLKMAASSEHTQRALKGLEAQAANAKSAALSLGKGLIIGAAAGMGFDAIRSKILGVIGTMADLKTISEKTGASVENLSILSFLSKQAGSDINGVASALAKMSKGMAGADNETKGAGLALSYLGVSAKDAAGNLKDPAAMFMDIAKKLGEYKDGAGKAAIAQALFGKSGAEMLPTLKLLSEQGELAAKVTTAQATAARQYERDLAKLNVQKNMLFKTIAMSLLPTMSDFTNAMIDVSKNTNVANKAVKGLAEDNTITTWADAGAMGLARLVDVIVMIPKAFSVVSASAQLAGANIKVLSATAALANPVEFAKKIAKGENPLADLDAAMREHKKVREDAGAKLDHLWNYDGAAMEKAMAARIANRGKATTTASGKPLKDLNYDSSGEDGEAGKREAEAGKFAKNLNAGRLKDLEAAHAKEQSEIEFANKYMAELRAQDIIDLSTYNDYRQKVLDSGLAAAVEAYDKEIKEAEKYRDSLKKGSEKVAAQTKVNELSAKKGKAVQDAQNEAKLATLGLSAAQSDLNKSMKEWNIQQDQSAAQLRFNNDLYGKSALEVAKLTEARRIELDIEEKIRQAQKNGTITPESISKYRADAKARAVAINPALAQAAGNQIGDSLMTPDESENRLYQNRIADLQAYQALSLENTIKGNELIERENRRHANVLMDTQSSNNLQALSMASANAGQLYSILKNAGAEKTALAKSLFLVQKAIAVAEILINTEKGAAVALGYGPFGIPMSTIIRAMGYATAGIVAGTAIAEASAEGGFDIPRGKNPITQLHEEEMVLPKEQANVIRGLASNGGSRGGPPIHYAPVFQIDSRADRAQAMAEMRQVAQQSNADLVDKLARAGRI